MSDTVVAAIITSGVTLIGLVLSIVAFFNKLNAQLAMHRAVTDTKIEQLTEEVRKHNSFGDRLTRLEVECANIKKKD